jgi:hypothetical protein
MIISVKFGFFYFIHTNIWILAYGCETWTIAREEMRRIEAFEMWCYRRMEKIS